MRAAVLVALALVAGTAAADDWRQKVDSSVLRNADANHRVEFLVLLDAQADLSGAAAVRTKRERGAFVYERVAEVAQRTQPALTAIIAAAGAPYHRFTVVNAILVEGDL